jgi:hypothetical protein
MSRTYTRKEFLKLSAAVGTSLLFADCSKAKDEPSVPAQKPKQSTVVPTDHTVTIIKKGDAEYDSLRQGFNKRISKFPLAIALCKSTEDVAEAIQYAREQKLPVAIKSGGHCFEGFSCNDGGLAINLSKLRSVEWLDATTIKVGPACTLSELYDTLLPKKRIIPAGSCGGVGIGGLTLGGGYGFFARKYGLTCDSLLEATVVDGKGVVHSTNDDAELLWACRGGNNGSMGVVTSLTFKTHPAPATFQSHRFKVRNLTASSAKELLELWFTNTAKLPASAFGAFVLNGKTLNILITDYEGRTSELKPVFDSFAAHSSKSLIGKPIHLASALKNYYGRRQPMYFKNSSAGLYKDISEISGCISEVLEIVTTTPGMIYQVNTLGGNIADPEFEKGSCFPHRSKNYLSELQTYWENPSAEKKLLERFAEVQNIFATHNITAQYANYPDINWSDWSTAYYDKNLLRLKAVKKKYDPENLFSHPQSIRD